MRIDYRKMKKEDIPAVFLIDQACFKHNWSSDSYKKEMDNILATYLVALDKGVIIGFSGYWLIVDEAHITNIAVLKAYRKKGVGQALLDRMSEMARALGCDKMTLEVREDNYPAISFYEKNDFVTEGVRLHYYGKDSHALIMWRRTYEN